MLINEDCLSNEGKIKICDKLNIDSFESISIKYWYVLAFTLLWNSFENEFFEEDFKRKKIKNFIKKILEKGNVDALIKGVDSNLLFWQSKFVDNEEMLGDHDDHDLIFHLGSYHFNLRFKKSETDKQRSFVANILRNSSTAESSERIEALILIIFRIRCNLFHGSKMLHHLESQEEIFCNAIKSLSAF